MEYSCRLTTLAWSMCVGKVRDREAPGERRKVITIVHDLPEKVLLSPCVLASSGSVTSMIHAPSFSSTHEFYKYNGISCRLIWHARTKVVSVSSPQTNAAAGQALGHHRRPRRERKERCGRRSVARRQCTAHALCTTAIDGGRDAN
jgi:uncharacterized protein YfiM (DUF2279 family)